MSSERRRSTPSRLVLATVLGAGLAAAPAGIDGIAAQAQETSGVGADVGADVGGVSADVGADVGSDGVDAHAEAGIGGGNGNGGQGNNGGGNGNGGQGNNGGGNGNGSQGNNSGGNGNGDGGQGDNSSSAGNSGSTGDEAAGPADATGDAGTASAGGSQTAASDSEDAGGAAYAGSQSHGAQKAPGTPAARAVEERYRYFLSLNTKTPAFRRYARAAEDNKLAAAGKALGEATFRPVTVDLVDYVNQQLGVQTKLASPQIVVIANASSPFRHTNAIAGAADTLIEDSGSQ